MRKYSCKLTHLSAHTNTLYIYIYIYMYVEREKIDNKVIRTEGEIY